ncbi:MAG: NUDIX hydrolase [Pseudomonadales bacterium]|nr:NUDIX hydrolase [Pseudomonadales bacterium]
MRNAIRAEILAIEPMDNRETDDVASTLAWIDSGAPLCRTAKPATPPWHLVSYFVLVDDNHVLLVDHLNAGLWLPTGGHVEDGEHPRDTVRREVREELNQGACFLRPAPLFLTVTRTVGNTAGHTDVSLWYVLRGDRHQAIEHDGSEFREACWFAPHELPFDRAEPQLRRFLAKLDT